MPPTNTLAYYTKMKQKKSFIRLIPGCCPSEKNVNVRLNFQKDEHFKIKLASLVVEYYNICDFFTD